MVQWLDYTDLLQQFPVECASNHFLSEEGINFFLIEEGINFDFEELNMVLCFLV